MLLSPRKNGLASLFKEVRFSRLFVLFGTCPIFRDFPDLSGNGPNTVSGSMVSNTELSEFFGAY